MTVRAPSSLRGFLDLPEFAVALFAFLLNFVWEMWQVPLYEGLPQAGHWASVKLCTRASFGDTGIALAAFWTAALVARSRYWIRRPRAGDLAAFVAVGLGITVVFERLATGALDRWTYAAVMPVVPGVEVGLSPLAQWLVLPPLVIWLARRYLFGAQGPGARPGRQCGRPRP